MVSQHSRAMVFHGSDRPLELRSFSLPRLQPGEVLVEVTCCTLCGSDLHTFTGSRTTPLPTILGHEILGRIAELPDDKPICDYTGNKLQIGDRVTWSVAASCGACFYCNQDLPQKCEHLFKYGHERIDTEHPLSGGLAEYCHLAPGTALVRVPDALSDEVACPANCATATVAAAFRYAGGCRDQSVLVQGAGMLGLTATAMARSLGAREVIVCDVNRQRLDQAGLFGATRTVTVGQDLGALKNLLAEVTEGRGVDLALELCGAPSAMEAGIDLLRTGGRYLLVGAVFPSRPAEVSAEIVVRKLLTIQGIHNYAPEDLVTAVRFLTDTQSEYPFGKLVGSTFSLDETESAFEHARTSGAFRVAVTPGNRGERRTETN